MTFPEAGDYCVVDELASARGSVLGGAPGRRLLGLVRTAAGEAVPADTTAHLREVLERAARRNIGADAQAEVVADLRDGLRLRRFVPHADVRDDEVTGTQTLTFNINVSQNAGNGNAFFEMDGRPYLPGRIDRTLILGSADEWRLTSGFVGHPFHIHVNPFQIVRIESPRAARAGGGEARRVDVAGTAEPDDFQVTADNAVARVGPADPQYAGLIGVWKDTLFVEGLLPLAPQVPVPPGARLEDYRYVVTIRTRYRRYIGDFVLHCHILDREDQRMMQNIRIALPDGRGGGSHGHH